MSRDHRVDPEGEGLSNERRTRRSHRLAVDAVAVAAALVSGLAINYLFVPPRHQLGIASAQDVIELLALMLAAGAVSRFAATARRRADEAERRALEAAAREREAGLLADAASVILSAHSVSTALSRLGQRVARASGAKRARLAIEPVPSPEPQERTIALGSNTVSAWLYVEGGEQPGGLELERLSGPLGSLIDVAVEREHVAKQAAQAQAATEAETLRTAVLHAISHDLRSPLTAIATAAGALRAPVGEEDRRELIDVIESEGRRLAKLVDDLLDLSKIEAGAVSPQSDWCDLSDVVASALAGLHSNHPVALGLASDLPLVRADSGQLERVFSNLIENAIKHSPPDEPVLVSTGSGAGKVTARVVDHGDGIPVSERPHVFEPFFRGSGRRGTGTGLGLAISRGFVEANGGRISLQSRGGHETTFAVTFDAAQVPQPGE